MPNPFTMGSFSQFDYPDQLRTIFGGNSSYIDPYTTGYHFMYFFPPTPLQSQVGKFLQTICLSVTIPGITVNPIEYNGTNNMKWYVPGTVEYENNRFSCKFNEFAGLPVLQIIGSWANIFRNMIYGIADPDTGGASQGDYKGRAIYATTLPDGKTIQFAAAFTGVFPLKVPTDSFGSDKATQEKVEMEIEFSFDMMYTGEQVMSTASSLVSSTVSSSISKITEMYSEAAGA